LICSLCTCSLTPNLPDISVILIAVRNLLCFTAIIIFGILLLALRPGWRTLAQSSPQQSAQPANQPPPEPGQSAARQLPATPPQASPAVQPAPVHTGPTIILDPAHGGTDSGARGQTGAIEKDVVLQYARVVRGELERQGFRVVLTREDDSNPSYDDRASVANAYRDAVFVSLHVSSTGAPGSARVYYYRFGSSPSGPSSSRNTAAATNSSPAASLVPWDEAQIPHIEMSHRLADALQGELAQRFGGSAATAAAVAVRGLRSVGSPAVAVELSSVSVEDPSSLLGMAGPLALSIARGLRAFRATASAGGN
jgi:N-acetylmuramoyl-L-alanine amidase